MKREEVLEKLCSYDIRNPNCNYNICDKDDDLYKGGIGVEETHESCYCDNCFYGRHKLAEYILELLEKHELRNNKG